MSEEFVGSYGIMLPILLIVVGICLVSLKKWGAVKNHDEKGVMTVNGGGLWAEKKLQRLRCSVKNYDWGKIGTDSVVYRLHAANSGAKIDPNKPYAELWMGTHESGPSYVITNGKNVGNGRFGDSGCVTLKSWIEKNPHVLGDKVRQKWGCDLPFLFKVLSVAKPLSIQAHPCKELAKKLHMRDPNTYKDENHKPEMALAITEFEALCGFVGLKDLQGILNDVPEISQLVGTTIINRVSSITTENGEDEIRDVLKQLFTQLMSASEPEVADILTQLTSRLRMKDQLTSKEKLVLRLEEQYPNDVGVLAAFLMNYVTLSPGQALCLGPNELHAYVSGDCIECMATSDNVVRAGLTPKQRDVVTLCDMLTYKQGCLEKLEGFPVDGSDGCTKRYRPPFEEFEVDHCNLSEGQSTTFPSVAGPSLFLVTKGTGVIRTSFSEEQVSVGDVLFAPSNTKLSIQSASRLEIYRAGVNSKFL